MDSMIQEDENTSQSRPLVAVFILTGGLMVLLFGLALSISVGAADIQLMTAWEAVLQFNPDLTPHQIVRELRLPRALGGALIGAAFAVAGAIMQGMTRNPLADTGLLGLNSGAAFILVLCFAFLPGLSYTYLILFSFLGAGTGAALVFGVGSLAKGGLSPVRLTLAGAAVSALFTALSEGIGLYFRVSQDIALWYAGGLAGVSWEQVAIITPWILLGLAGAMMISRSITILSLGEDVSVGLGQRNQLVKVIGAAVVLVLAGAAVATVGAVAFVGLIIPHIARFLVGVDYRWIIPCSAVLGSLLIVYGDIAARMINPPYETPLGALITLIGIPFFLYLARKKGREL